MAIPDKIAHKTKLLYIKQILERYTDADHDITQAQIQEKLEKKGLAPKTRTLHDDLESLYECQKDFDIELENNVKPGKDKAHTLRYKITKRLFTPTEVKLLMESVRGLKSLSMEQTEILIDKLSSLCSEAEAQDIKKHFAVVGGFKAFRNKRRDYDLTLRAIEAIDKAIDQNTKIRFAYFWYSVNHKPTFPKDKTYRHIVSPLVRVLEGGYYYLVALNEEGDVRHYRLDRMTDIVVLGTKRTIPANSPVISMDWKEYVNSSFGLGLTNFYNAVIAEIIHRKGIDHIPSVTNNRLIVSIRFTRDLVGVVMDRFGRDIPLTPVGKTHFIATFQAYKNVQFLTWLVGLGNKVQIISPDDLRKDVSRFARAAGMWHNYNRFVVMSEYRMWTLRKPYWADKPEDHYAVRFEPVEPSNKNPSSSKTGMES